jgi:hypothetical protein
MPATRSPPPEPRTSLHPVLRSRGACDRRWARSSSRPVAPMPRALRAIASCQVTPAGPSTTAAPIRRASSKSHASAGATALTAERGLRGDEPRRALSPPHSRPRDRAPHRTGARVGTGRQPHKRRKPKPRWLGLLVVVGHSGLEPEANGLRRVRGAKANTDKFRYLW